MKFDISTLTTDDVLSVYSGRPGCACGCRGNHRGNPKHEVELGKETDFSARSVASILRAVKAAPVEALQFDDETMWISTVDDARERIVYLTKAARERIMSAA